MNIVNRFCKVDEIHDSYPVNEILDTLKRNDPDMFIRFRHRRRKYVRGTEKKSKRRMFKKYQDDNDFGETIKSVNIFRRGMLILLKNFHI